MKTSAFQSGECGCALFDPSKYYAHPISTLWGGGTNYSRKRNRTKQRAGSVEKRSLQDDGQVINSVHQHGEVLFGGNAARKHRGGDPSQMLFAEGTFSGPSAYMGQVNTGAEYDNSKYELNTNNEGIGHETSGGAYNKMRKTPSVGKKSNIQLAHENKQANANANANTVHGTRIMSHARHTVEFTQKELDRLAHVLSNLENDKNSEKNKPANANTVHGTRIMSHDATNTEQAQVRTAHPNRCPKSLECPACGYVATEFTQSELNRRAHVLTNFENDENDENDEENKLARRQKGKNKSQQSELGKSMIVNVKKGTQVRKVKTHVVLPADANIANKKNANIANKKGQNCSNVKCEQTGGEEFPQDKLDVLENVMNKVGGGKSSRKNKRINKKAIDGGGSDFLMVHNSRGPVNYPTTSPDKFKEFTKTGKYITNQQLVAAPLSSPMFNEATPRGYNYYSPY